MTEKTYKRVALVRARWHSNVVDKAVESFQAMWTEMGNQAGSVDVYDVPGAFEIPLHAKALAESGDYEAVVGVAFVVDGGIYRHDFVATAVVEGLMRVQLDVGVPVLSVVLTPHNFQETEVLVQFFEDHFVKKGYEAAHACAAILRARAEVSEIATSFEKQPVRKAASNRR